MLHTNYKVVIFSLFLSLLFVACSPEDPLINSGSVSWSSLVIFEGGTGISVVTLPSKNTSTSVQLPPEVLQNAAVKIAYFRDKIYVLSPQTFTMYIVQDKSFVILDTIKFDSTNLKPTAISFANATTAYIAHENQPVISIFDLTIKKVVSTIAISTPSKDISSFENQVYAVCPESNSVMVIDTRTNKITKTIETYDAPTFIGIDIDNRLVLVLCAGKGKTKDTLQNPVEKTRMKLAYIDPVDNSIVTQTDMIVIQANPSGAIPTSFAVTERYRAYVTTNQGMIRINTFTKSGAVRTSQSVFSTVQYNIRRGEITLLQQRSNGSTIFTADRLTGTTIETHIFTTPIRSIFPI